MIPQASQKFNVISCEDSKDIYIRFNCSIPLFKWMDVAFGMRDSQIVLFYNHSPGTSETAAVWNVFSTTSDSPRLTEAGNNSSFVDVVL